MMISSVVLMTPEMAESILLKNTSNRNMRQQTVNHIAKIILNGEWITTHQGIAISTDDVLLDGQHRLAAIVKAGIPVNIMLSTGVCKDSFMAIDYGLKRSASDVTGVNCFIDVSTFIMRTIFKIKRPTPQELVFVHSKIEDYIKIPRTTSAIFSSSAFKAAAIIRIIDGVDADYVVNSYSNLVCSEFEGSSPVVIAALKYKLKGRFNALSSSGGGVRQEVFFRLAMRIFDVRNKALTQIGGKGQEYLSQVDVAIKILEKIGLTKESIDSRN